MHSISVGMRQLDPKERMLVAIKILTDLRVRLATKLEKVDFWEVLFAYEDDVRCE